MKKLVLALVILGLVGAVGAGGLVVTGVVDRARVKSLLKRVLAKAGKSAAPKAKGCPPQGAPEMKASLPKPGKYGVASSGAKTAQRKVDACPVYGHSFNIPVTINDGANTIVRSPELTGFLVPFARDTLLFSVNGLVVKDASGAVLPSQFEVLSRYDAHPDDCQAPIRHAYARVLKVAKSATWTVSHDPSVGHTGPAIKVDDSGDSFVVDTGAARFTIGKTKFGIDKVERIVEGQAVVVSEKGEFIVNHGGELTASHAAPWKIEVERNGPVTATILARGYYANGSKSRDLGYTVRLHMTAGSATLVVDHTYYHGAVQGYAADQVSNLTEIGGAKLKLPLASVTEVYGRANKNSAKSQGALRVEQHKRTDKNAAVRYTVKSAEKEIESGTWARNPYIAAIGPQVVIATIARMSERDPQAISWDGSGALEIHWTSTPMQVGGARGIWSTAAIDFGADRSAIEAAANQLQLHAERPLLGATQPAYANTTGAIGPYATKETPRFAPYFEMIAEIHKNTRTYLEEKRVTGLQIWPDLPDIACGDADPCAAEDFYYDGGKNNYWNWSKPGFDEFFRTGDNSKIYDFSLGEAVTFAETIAIRTDPDKIKTSGMTGMAPCYGSSFGFGQTFREGLNNRVDNCPGDYSYNKHLQMAYLATGDRRFVDFFEDAGLAAIDTLGPPAIETVEFAELTIGRLAEQRLENVLNGAEFSRTKKTSDTLRKTLRDYLNLMLDNMLVDGHLCDTSGSSLNSVCATKKCESTQAWMVPTPYAALVRSSKFLSHARLRKWTIGYGAKAARHHGVLGANGIPDIKAREAKSADDAKNGWRTIYTCAASDKGIDSATCKKVTDVESEGLFYDNGMLSFMNVFGMNLAADPKDPNKVCQWLPDAWAEQLKLVPEYDLNSLVWGKASGQALAYSAEAVGALTACP